MATQEGGFECEFIEKPPKAVQSECPVCLLVLREPYQVTCCGYSFCRVCTERIKLRNIPCPCCKAEEFDHYPNKGLQRSLYEFKVKCVNDIERCQWVGELGQLDNHLNSNPTKEKQLEGCQYVKIECLYCSEHFQRSNIQAHQNDKCLSRPFSCEYCGEFDSHYEDVINNHWPVCDNYPLPCPNKCGETLQRQNLKSHIVTDCSQTTIDCDFQHVGCEVRLPRKDMQAHLQENIVTHISLLMASHKKLEEENKQLRDQVNKLEQDVQTLSTHSVPNDVIFTMTDFSQHKQDDEDWMSPPFYSHQHGYKLCLGVYPNGLGQGENSHVSVYVHAMRGDYDNLLMWPFKGALKITLLGNNANKIKHTLDFNDDFTLERVTEDTVSDEGYGLAEFLPHSSLELFLIDDTLCFKVSDISVNITANN